MKSCSTSPRLRFIAYALCLVVCPAKIIALVLSSSAVMSTLSGVDYRLPLIAAGWTCIGLATFLMMRANRELASPTTCPVRKRVD